MHARAASEMVFDRCNGPSARTGRLAWNPCIPKTWPGFEITLRDRTTTYRIRVENPHLVNRGVERIALDGKTLLDSVLPRLQDGRVHDVEVRMRPAGDNCA
jgi:cyclic beta-1,2-glucan synthetase